MVMTKLKDVTKQGSCKILWRKLRLQGSLLLVLIQFFWGGGWVGGVGVGVVAYLSLSEIGREVGWGGRLFETGHLLTFSAFRMGAYSRWALLRINAVVWKMFYVSLPHSPSYPLEEEGWGKETDDISVLARSKSKTTCGKILETASPPLPHWPYCFCLGGRGLWGGCWKV